MTTATLNGTLTSDRGFTASCYFEYGLTTGYGSDTSASPTTCSEGDSFSAVITGLTPGGTYHYRAIAVSFLGTVYGDDESFIVPVVLLEVMSVSVSVDGNFATISGRLIYDGGEECTVGFEYGGSNFYGSELVVADKKVSDDDFSYTFLSITTDVLFHTRAYATNTKGTVYGLDMSFYIPKNSDAFGGMMGGGLVNLLMES